MANFLEGNMKDFMEAKRRDEEYYKDYLKDRIVKRCKCGNVYSYGLERNYVDPKSCPSCGGRLGEIG